MKGLKLAGGILLAWGLSGGVPPTVAATTPVMPVGTYVLKLSVMTERNRLAGSAKNYSLRAVNARGVTIAESAVKDPDASGVNAMLAVPLQSVSTDYGATVGEQLNVVMLAEDGVEGALVGTTPLTVGGANAVGKVTLQLAETKAFTRGDETVSIPTDYIDAQEALFAFYRAFYHYDIGAQYDPWADYDLDGSSNYAEYVAGTNPFIPNDTFKVTNYRTVSPEEHEITFEYAGGRLYRLKAAATPGADDWTERGRYTFGSPEANPEDDEEVGTATIKVVPAAVREFYRMEVLQ